MQFISSDVVDAAKTREVQSLSSDPVIFGVDCARFGDDTSVLAIRCGRDAKSRPWKRWHKQDAMTIASEIALEAMRWKPDAIFVDAGNIGAAVVDRLRQLGVENVFEVWFGGEGGMAYLDNGVTVHTGNKRTQMWTRMRAWLPGGAIPEDQRLTDDLVGPTYSFGADEVSIVLERKKDMKKRGLPSPDDGDALAVTFAEPVLPRSVPNYLNPESYGQQLQEIAMMNSNPMPASFEEWCKLSGLDRDFVRRNYSVVRKRFEVDPLTPMTALPPPSAKPVDRFSEI